MGEAVENLIALASAATLASQRERSDVSGIVRAHTRVLNGQLIQVESYTRNPASMSKEEIEVEIAALHRADQASESAKPMDVVRTRMRLTALLREAAGRQRAGSWGNDNRDMLSSRSSVDHNDTRADLLSQRGPAATIHYPIGHPKHQSD